MFITIRVGRQGQRRDGRLHLINLFGSKIEWKHIPKIKVTNFWIILITKNSLLIAQFPKELFNKIILISIHKKVTRLLIQRKPKKLKWTWMRINNSHRLLCTPIPLLPKKYCCLQLLKPFFTPWKVIQWPESGKFFACGIWNPGLWTPNIQFKEFTMPLTIGIRNPSSTLKEYRIP